MFGDRNVNFLRGDLERVIREALVDTPIRLGTSPRVIDQAASSGVYVVFDDGSSEHAELLLAADGVHSAVRSLVCGPEPAFRLDLGHVTAAYLLDTLPSGVPARSFTTVSDAGRMAAVYPTPDGRAATLFVHRTADARAELATGAASLLRRRYADLGWVVPQLLDAVPETGVYLDQVIKIQVPRWHIGRIALIEDAAWCVSLPARPRRLAATAGAERLGSALGQCADVPMALGAWERSMRPLVESVQASGRRTAAYFVPQDPLRSWLRDMALRASAWPVAARIARTAVGAGKAG